MHYTPQAVADELVRISFREFDSELDGPAPSIVCDPACGGGVFLLAVADALLAAGRTPLEALSALRGMDIDPGAVAVAREALALWALDHGVEPPSFEATVVTGDSLVDRWSDEGAIDVVVGNPPFGGQLGGSTVRDATAADAALRLLGRAVGYADTAGLFMVRALGAVGDGGSVVLIQPLSILGARDAGIVRDAVDSALVAVWFPTDDVFDASVHVCAPVLRKGRGAGSVDILGLGEHMQIVRPSDSESWSPIAAAAMGVPFIPLDGRRIIADRADATAGFRDEFYDVASCVRELDDAAAGSPRLVTVGLIEPARSLWGSKDTRVAGRTFRRPVVDVARLHGRAASEAGVRLRPKVLVATQTRVLEAIVDVDGSMWPSVPVISVLPLSHAADADGTDLDLELELWMLAAAVMAPPAVAWMARRATGTGRSRSSLRVSASQIGQIPLPIDEASWREAAVLLRDGGSVVDAALPLTRAHGLADAQVDELMTWWSGRLGRRGAGV